MKILCVIPARGGSKGIPRKNISVLAGKPLIDYTIEQAKQSKLFGRIVVTSDATAILDVARQHSRVHLIHRPGHLAGDTTPMTEVLVHALGEMEKQKYLPDLVVLLQPTSPLRSVATVKKAVTSFSERVSDFDSLMPVAKVSSKIGTIEEGLFVPQYRVNAQRQELKELYYDCGTVYIFKPALIERHNLPGEKIFAFVVPWPESLDIDTPSDMKLAELLLKKNVCA